MENIKQFKENFSEKTIITLTVGIIIFISFYGFLERIITNLIIKFDFFYPESVWYNDVFFIIMIIIILFFSYSRYKRNHIESTKDTSVFIIIVILYFFIRSSDTPLDFTPLSEYNFIKYADLIVLFAFAKIFLVLSYIWKNNLNTKNIKENNLLLEDISIGKYGEDTLGYKPYADRLAKKILKNQFNQSFAIGINGKWGVGKTSFFDLLKRNFKNENVIEIDFNPWKSSSSKLIIKDFFDVILGGISPYHYSISRKIQQYSDKLISNNGNLTAQFFHTILEIFIGDESIEALYNEIDKAFIKIDKKVIIYIDDVDRLDYNEIYEVLRLIRNTGSFHNIVFIVAYDRDYIVNLLSQNNLHNSDLFLEKIFQFEISLPYFDKYILRKLLVNKLSKNCPEKYKAPIEKIISTDYNSLNYSYLDHWVGHVRDVNRIVNSLTINLDTLWGDVEFGDFFRMELLRIKHPSVYRLIHKQANKFLTMKVGDYNWRYFILKDQDFEKYLKTNISVLKISESDISEITKLLKNIFPNEEDIFILKRSHLSIIYPSKFYRYFTFDLLKGNLSEIEFSRTRSGSLETFKEKITSWVKEGLSDEIKEKLMIIRDFDNRVDFENIITATFHLASLTSQKKESNGLMIGYSNTDIFNKLGDTSKISKLYYNENQTDYISFVKSLFTNAKPPFKFESDFIEYITDMDMEDFPISKIEFQEINIEYLRKYANISESLDDNIWGLYHNCKIGSKRIYTNQNIIEKEKIPSQAKHIMKSFILEKDMDNFMRVIIHKESGECKKFSVSRIVVELFDGWNPFLALLEESKFKDSEYITEFKNFIEIYKANGFKKAVPFTFDIIPVCE